MFAVRNKYKLHCSYFRHSCVKNSAILSTTLQSFPPSQISPPILSRAKSKHWAKSNSRNREFLVIGVYILVSIRRKIMQRRGGEESRIFQFLRSNFTQEKTNNRWLVWVVCYSVSRNVASRKCKYCYTMKFKHYHPK